MIHPLLEKALRIINDISLRKKLFLSYFLLSVLPFTLVIGIYYSRTSEKLEQQAIVSARQVFEQTKSLLDSKTNNYREIADVITLNSDLQTILNREMESYSQNLFLQNTDLTKLNLFFSNLALSRKVYGFRLYVPDGLAYSNENTTYFELSEAIKSSWFASADAKSGRFQWFPSHYFEGEASTQDKVIAAVRFISSSRSYTEIAGIVRLDLPVSDLEDILQKSKITPSSQVFLLNASKEILHHSGEASDFYNAINCLAMENYAGGNFKESYWQSLYVNGQKAFVGVRNVESTDWKLVYAVPYSDIVASNNRLRNEMLLFTFLIMLAAFGFSYIISYTHTRRIQRLIRNMRKVVDGNFDISILEPSQDEIGELTKNFNFMLTKVAMLMDDKFRTGQEMKSMELKALQAQINPHFLYNTLDLVNWISMENNVPEISSLIFSLSRYYKLSLRKGEDIVSLSDELEHAQLYVWIQNKRFYDKIALTVEVPESLLSYRILKLTLQPILENSILHGIMERPEKRGHITILGFIENRTGIIFVKDDGIGIPEDKLKLIKAGTYESANGGYGLKNINQRLQLYYGKEYGLDFNSTPGRGTEIIIRFPILF